VAFSDEIRDFLLSRRGGISPEQAGLPRYGERRVAGLRREEVAQLAGISVEYYTRLERGNARGYSNDVLAAVADALQLDDAEREHLFDLVHSANARRGAHPSPSSQPLRPGVQRLLDALVTAPAYVWNSRLDIVATNPLGRALSALIFDRPGRPPNSARFIFLDPAAREFFPDWEQLAHDAVAMLRAGAVQNPGDALVGELSAASEVFRDMWDAYDVRRRRTGKKRFCHPVAGLLTVEFESMTPAGHPGLRLVAGTAEPGSRSEAALRFLEHWTTANHVTEGQA
jgi:transcriptional regulator with XRE-family HTH domain